MKIIQALLLLLKLLENNTSAAAVAEIYLKNNRKTALSHHRPQTEAHSNEYLVRDQYTQSKTSPAGLARRPAGVVGTPSRRCPAATVPATVVCACGFRCCFAEIAEKKNKIACYYAAAVAEIT